MAARDNDDAPIAFIIVAVPHGTAPPPHYTNSPLHQHPISATTTVSTAALLYLASTAAMATTP